MRAAELKTPAFVVDLAALARNLQILAQVKEDSGARILLALKGFSLFHVFPQLRAVLDGCCASSPDEARLGAECFGGEVHAYAAAFSDADLRALCGHVDHISFNSFGQWRRHRGAVAASGRAIRCGLRINPQHSEGAVPIYDPCAPGSRLGICREAFEGESLAGLDGLHMHTLCEQNADALARTLAAAEAQFGAILPRMQWFNLGGGHHITRADYDRERLCELVRQVSRRYDLQVYLEPGEAVALDAGVLVTTVLDVVHNAVDIAILDTSCTCHMPDVIEMPYRPRVFRAEGWEGAASPSAGAARGGEPGEHPHTYRLAGLSCLAGDVIGDYAFESPLKTGDRLVFEDMAHYTMVKTTTFNGVRLPRMALRQERGDIAVVREFQYEDFMSRLG